MSQERKQSAPDSLPDAQVQRAIERGEFDDLPGFGKPIEGLGASHDPDWWVKRLVEREQITGVLPPALQIRKDDAGLDDQLDRISAESEVRREVEDFNARVLKARFQPLGGPPMVTVERDAEETVEAWRARRQERITEQQEALARREPEPRRRRWPRWSGRRRTRD